MDAPPGVFRTCRDQVAPHVQTQQAKWAACALLAGVVAGAIPPANAQAYSVQDECYRNTEQYIPGYTAPDGRYQSGYVRANREAVPCGSSVASAAIPASYRQGVPRCDRNSTIFNGLLGGGIAAALSKPDAYAWSVPLGLALGVSSSRIGCR